MNAEDALPVGSTVGEFEIRRVIGWGGAGIVYEAYDPGLDRVVALKELYLAQHVRRNGADVEPLRRSSVHVLEAGKARFLREARLLAMLHERASGSVSLVLVHRVLQQNRTAYMAMKLYSGETLRTVVLRGTGTFTQPRLVALMHKLLDALDALHSVPGEALVHRDVSPDNIIIQPDGEPVLLDFGASRSTKGEITAMIFKPGFSPIEQYTDKFPQGPWTDLYALCGVAYFAISGRAPEDAAMRLAGKPMRPARELGAGRFSDAFLDLVDCGLRLLPPERFADVGVLRAALSALAPFDAIVAGVPAGPDAALARAYAPTQIATQRLPPRGTVGTPALPDDERTRVWPATVLLPRTSVPSAPAAAATTGTPALPRWASGWVFGALALVIVALVAWGVARMRAAAPAVAPARPEAGVQPAPGPVATPGPTPDPPPLANIEGLDCGHASATWACIVGGLERGMPMAGTLGLDVEPLKAAPGGDLQASVTSATGGYLYLYLLAEHAGGQPALRFPNPADRNNQLLPGVPLQLPRPGWTLQLPSALGPVRIVAVVVDAPLQQLAATAPRLADAAAAFERRQPMGALGWPPCTGSCPQALALATARVEAR